MTGPLADALNWAGISEDEFNKKLAACNSEQERASLITSTLNGEYAAAAEEYNKLTASTQAARDATNNMEQTQAALGAAIEPVTTAWTNLKAQALEAILPVVQGVSSAFQGISQWMAENPAQAEIVKAALIGIAAALGVLAVALSIGPIITVVTAAFSALNLTMLMNPITFIVAGIAALVAAFLYLWNNCESFRGFWIGLWDNIKAVASAVWEGIKAVFSGAWEGIKSAWNGAVAFFSGIWNGIVAAFSAVGSWFSSIFSAAWKGIQSAWSAVTEFFAGVWDGIVAVFSVVGSWFADVFLAAWQGIQTIWSGVVAFFSGIWNGIVAVFSIVGSWFAMIFSAAWQGIQTIWNAATGYFAQIWASIAGVFSVVKNVLSGNFKGAWEAIKGIFSSWGAYFVGLYNQCVNAFKNIGSKFMEVGKNIVAGIKEGVSSAWNNMVEWFKGLFGDLVGIAKKILGIESPSKVFRDEVGKMIVAGLEVGIRRDSYLPARALEGVFAEMQKIVEKGKEKQGKTIADYNAEQAQATAEHNEAIAKLEKEKNEELLKLDEELANARNSSGVDVSSKLTTYEDIIKVETEYADKVAAVNEKYSKSIEEQNKKHADNIEKIEDQKREIIEGKMQDILTLEREYKDNVSEIWEELDKEVSELQKNYDDTLASRAESIANSMNLWDEATKNKVTGAELKKNLQTQVKTLEDYNKAIAKLEERNVDAGFLEFLKAEGVGSTGEIEAIAKMSDSALASYIELWQKKNALAEEAAKEELEPLKAETEAQIEALTDAALDKYTALRAEWTEQNALLVQDLQNTMIEAGAAGYYEILAQIAAYKDAGQSLMDGIAEGIADKSSVVVEAVTNAVQRAIAAAKEEAGIHSPSKVTKKEIGANLALGVKEGWEEKLRTLKNTFSSSMAGTLTNLRATVSAENAKYSRSPGMADTGFADLARAVGTQTAGINSLASEYRRGSSTTRPIILQLDKRELGRAFVDVGGTEEVRIGTKISLGGAY